MKTKKIAIAMAILMWLLAAHSVSYVLSASSSVSAERSASVTLYRAKTSSVADNVVSQLRQKAAKTGDDSYAPAVLVIGCISGLVMIVLVIVLKKKKTKKYYMLLPLLILLSCAMILLLNFTGKARATGISGSQIGFIGGGQPPFPTDPNEVSREVDPGSGYDVVGINDLYLTMSPHLDFGNNPITAGDAAYPAKQIPVVYPDTGESAFLTPYIEIADERLSSSAWQVTATLAKQFSNEKGEELKGTEIHLNHIRHYDNEYQTDHISSPAEVVLRPGAEQLVLSASQAADSYRYYAVFDQAFLQVPGKTDKSEGVYTADIIWKLYDTP